LRAQWQSESQGNSALGLESLTFEEWVQKKYPETGINSALTNALADTGIEVNFPSSDNADLQVDKIIQDIPGKLTPADITTDNITSATSLGTQQAEKNPGMFDKAKTFLSGIFGDLFDIEELKRAAILYLGARVLGFSGDTAAQFAAKTYLTREENYNDHIRKLVEDGDYTPASIEKFKKSKDRKDLVRVGTPANFTGETEDWYRRSINGDVIKVVAAKMKIGDTFQYVDQANGKPVFKVDHQVNPMYDSNSTEGIQFQKTLKETGVNSFKAMNVIPGKDGDPQTTKLTLNAQRAGANLSNFAIKNNLSLQQADELMALAFDNAFAFRQKQLKDNKPDKAAKVMSLTPWLHDAFINEKIGSANRFSTHNPFEGATPEQRTNAIQRQFATMNNNKVQAMFDASDKLNRDRLIESGVSEADAIRQYPSTYDRFMQNKVFRETMIVRGAVADWTRISQPQIENSDGVFVTNPDYNEALTNAVIKRAESNDTTFAYEHFLMELGKKTN